MGLTRWEKALLFGLSDEAWLMVERHLPRRQAVSEVLAGRVSMLLAGVPAGLPFVNSGQLRGLAVSSAERSSALPAVPSMAEQGFPDVDINSWVSIHAPARTPPEILARLEREAVATLADPAVIARLREQGGTPGRLSPTQFAAEIEADSARWQQVIAASNIRMEG